MKNKLFALAFATGLGMIGAQGAQAGDIKASYKVGSGTTFETTDGEFKVKLSTRVQTRYTFNGLEETDNTHTVAIQRGKVALEGQTLSDQLRFKFQMNLATRNAASTNAFCVDAPCSTANGITTESTTGLATLEDAWFDYVPYSFLGVKVGQFKVPYLVQELTSSGRQQFVDRSLATGFFNFQYDLGAAIHGNLIGKKLNYTIHAFNGEGINAFNANQGMILGSRLEFIPFGEYAYSESDVDHSDEFNWGMGVAYNFVDHGRNFQSNRILRNIMAHHATFDTGMKYKGWSFQGAAMISRAVEGNKLTNWGYNGQLGYFVVPKKVELAVKTNGTIFSDALVNQYEHSVGLNYYIKGHGIKVQADYALLQGTRGDDLNDHRFRTQLQVVF